MAWLRSGTCCQCGECCHGNPWEGPVAERPPETRHRQPKREVQGMCPLFKWLPDGRGFCKRHDGQNEHPYHRAACAPWPTEPCQIEPYKKCSYSFTWID